MRQLTGHVPGTGRSGCRHVDGTRGNWYDGEFAPDPTGRDWRCHRCRAVIVNPQLGRGILAGALTAIMLAGLFWALINTRP